MTRPASEPLARRHLMKRRLGGSARRRAVGSRLSASVLARQGVVYTRDGRTLEGDGRGEARPGHRRHPRHQDRPSARDNVDRATSGYFDNVEAGTRTSSPSSPKSRDGQDHLGTRPLGVRRQAYDLARGEIERPARSTPTAPRPPRSKQTVMSQRRMDKGRRRRRQRRATHAATRTAPRPRGPRNAATRRGGRRRSANYLTPDDINTIRQIEWQENDTAPPRQASRPATSASGTSSYKAHRPGGSPR